MKKIVILGGGTAGWLTALFLKKKWKNLDITVVEDPSKPPIIAGESGSFAVNNLLEELDIDLFQWAINTNAMPKLGGKFVDWYDLGHTFTHSVIDTNKRQKQIAESAPITHQLYDLITLDKGISVSDSYYWNCLLENNMIPHVTSDKRGYDAYIMPMYHFDSRANAAYLKKIGLVRGVKLLEKKFVKHTYDGDTGDILSLIFDDATSIEGDWFFDCSGFAKLLLKEALGVKYIDYSQQFPASSVLGWWGKEVEYKSYTELTAMKYGWSWNINIRNRSGNGYIYDNTEITADQALEEAEKRFNIKIDPIASFTYKPDLASEFWKNNVIGVGISTGFAEPLESNGLGVAVHSIVNLSLYWDPYNKTGVAEKKLYNEEMLRQTTGVIDFINLHYRGKRTDSSYWLKLKDRSTWTDRVKDYVDMWGNGILGEYNLYSAYSAGSFLTVGQALHLFDKDKIRDRLYNLNSQDAIYVYENKIIPEKEAFKKKMMDTCYTTEGWAKAFYATYGTKGRTEIT